jgi:hypothetical protein
VAAPSGLSFMPLFAPRADLTSGEPVVLLTLSPGEAPSQGLSSYDPGIPGGNGYHQTDPFTGLITLLFNPPGD